MCAPAPVTPPAGAFELEIEESQWHHVYNAIEYIKQGQRERKMTDPSDAIHSALDDFWEVQNGSCLLYTSPSPRDIRRSRMPSSA